LTALSFAVAAATNGERALFVTFEEAPNQLIRNASRLGWDVQGLVEKGALHFTHVSPSELDLDRHAFELSERADQLHARLVVIDSISAFDLRQDIGDASAAEFLWALTDYFKRKGISLILTTEAYSFFESASSERRNSYLSDSIILLRLVEADNDMRRMINVLKMRGGQHDSALRELQFTDSGMRVAHA
jgi:circadian clock protein KaiC